MAYGIDITSIKDATPVPHNGQNRKTAKSIINYELLITNYEFK